MRIIETKVYTFDELSDKAKERARDWWREASAGDNDFADNVLEEAARFGELLGIEFKQTPVKLLNGSTRYEPAIYWSGFSSQGDGACFEGSYAYHAGGAEAIAAEVPDGTGDSNTELNRIARKLTALQAANGYALTASITKTSHHYTHERTVEIDVHAADDSEADEPTTEALRELLRAFMRWIYRGLETEYEYQNSAEYIDETISANEYEFTEDGRRARG